MTYSRMGRPPKYHTTEEKLQAIQAKSQRYYATHRWEISTRQKLSYQSQSSHRARDKQDVFQPAPQATSPSKIRNANSHLLVLSLTSRFTTRLKKIHNTNQYEVTSIPAIVPPPAPPPDTFPRFNAEASMVLQEFEDFLEGKVPSDYVKSLLSRYFKDNSWQQGEIGIFVEPLDDLYRMQTAYKDISVKVLQADGPSKRQKKMECAGEKIGQLIS
ncbi:hypothetical protein EDD85DRAFT_952113 [Armillaria nabsnona]|nr:hypothetical protein EDD85DRAFT_952113 [Armillaria nabsnona]